MSKVSENEIDLLLRRFRAATLDQRFESLKASYEDRLPPPSSSEVQMPTEEQNETAKTGEVLQQFRSATFSERFERLLLAFQAFLEEHPQRKQGFNIFTLLRIHEREVYTHSMFLRELLNPYGSHEQDFLFLRTFLEHCHSSLAEVIKDGKRINQPFPDLTGEDLATKQWLVSREYDTKGKGRLDILIRCEELKFLCIIENKIKSPEDEGQLRSYWQWLSEPERKAAYPKQALIFLTPCGRESDYPEGASYYRMSYKEDVIKWLEAALKKREMPALEAIIDQYLATIEVIAEC